MEDNGGGCGFATIGAVIIGIRRMKAASSGHERGHAAAIGRDAQASAMARDAAVHHRPAAFSYATRTNGAKGAR